MCSETDKNKINIYLVIEIYLYRVDIIRSQANFHTCPVVILLYKNKKLIIEYIIQMVYIIQI